MFREGVSDDNVSAFVDVLRTCSEKFGPRLDELIRQKLRELADCFEEEHSRRLYARQGINIVESEMDSFPSLEEDSSDRHLSAAQGLIAQAMEAGEDWMHYDHKTHEEVLRT